MATLSPTEAREEMRDQQSLGVTAQPHRSAWAGAAEQPNDARLFSSPLALGLGTRGWIAQRKLSELSGDGLITGVRDNKQTRVIIGN